MSSRPDIPGVIAPPPLIFGVPLLLGLLLHNFLPRALLPAPWPGILGPAGVVLGLLALPALFAFRRAGTHPEPWKPTTALVISGPYRFSRNPMYVGMTFLYLGITCWVNTLWPLPLLPLVLLVMRYGVIAREEAYMERLFGEEYRAYRARVRRWL